MKILVTNNSNLLVKNEENVFGFFNKEGKLLREATAREFFWAEERMPEYSGSEINFDFSFLEEKLRLKNEETMRKLTSFTGMSEEIVQKILDNFRGNPGGLKISGQMPFDWARSECSTCGCDYSYQEWCNVWGILSSGKVISVSAITLELSSRQNANGNWSDVRGYTAEYLTASVPDAKFFIVNSGLRDITDHGNYNETKDENHWEIFRTPNMFPILEARREEATSRIEDFLLGFKNNLNSQRIYETIEGIGISDVDIVNISALEIGHEWSVEGVCTGGCAYSDKNEFFVWAVDSVNDVVKIDSIIMTEDAGQNANGSSSDSYGYNFKYLMKMAPTSSFFVMKEHHKFYAEKQQGSESTTWWLLRPLTRKEIMIEKINSNNRPTTFADLLKK